MNKNILAAVALLLLAINFLSMGFVLPAWNQEKAGSAVEKMFDCQFGQALSTVDSMSPDSADDPLKWMLKLSIIGMRHLDYDDTSDSNYFETTYETTQSLFKKYEKKMGRTSYLLTADGFGCFIAAAYKMHHKDYLKGIQLGFEALSYGREAKKIDSANADIDLILGLYSYARAELKKKFWGILFWYPGDKNTGILAIKRASEAGQFSSLAAQAALVEIHIREARYGKALSGINQLAARYPHSRFILWSKAKLYEAQKLYSGGADTYAELADAYEMVPSAARNYHQTLFFEAQRYYWAGNIIKAEAACNKLLGACSRNPTELCTEANKILAKIRRPLH
jgi:predicted Zn-dependent protease